MRSLLRHANYYKKKFAFFFKPGIRISRKRVSFGDKKMKNSNFYKNRKAFKIYDIDIIKN